MDSVEKLKDLYQDLRAFSESRLANVDRLWVELETSVQEFRKLLDKPVKSNTSRQTLTLGKIKIQDEEYSVNDEFQQIALQIADALDLDELEAAKLTLAVQGDIVLPTQSLVLLAITKFHTERDFLLQSLREILRQSIEVDDTDGLQTQLQDVVAGILEITGGPASNGSAYTRKCLAAMDGIEKWQARIAEQMQRALLLGQAHGPELLAILDFEKIILSRQHEALGVIVAYLFKGNYTISEDLRKLLEVPQRWDRLEVSLVHYLPAFSAAFSQYGSPDRSSSMRDARSLHTFIAHQDRRNIPSTLQPFHATLLLWWVAEYSGWYRDSTNISPLQGVDLAKEGNERANQVKTALEDGALEFLVSICASMSIDEWHHPARQELVTILLSDNNGLSLDLESISDPFQLIFMESLENFAESWITNMPDSIRQLKSEEDDRRLQQITAMQDELSSNLQREIDSRMHLECFLVMISFAFEHRIEAAEEFWADPDSNLFGFLQWSSKRQTVPRVSAFCEMLCAISEGPECGPSAHKFLLDESITTPRMRKLPSMSYAQMFAELELYAFKVHERPVTSQVPHVRKVLSTDMNELESPVMLACYLRLIAHMCREAPVARDYILSNPSFNFVQILLILSSGPVPSYLRASIFTTLEALMTDKVSEGASTLWNILDQWVSGGPASLAPALAKVVQVVNPPLQTMQHTLNAIALSFDQYDAFVTLLRTLFSPASTSSSRQLLPFPEDLGSSYRMPGVEPYVDFVCGQLFAKKMQELPDEGQIRIFRFHCLTFIATCLESFNESLVAVISRADGSAALAGGSTNLAVYAQRHPFARTMEWLFNGEVIKSLLACTHQSIEDVESSAPNSILIAGLQLSIDIVNLILDLQPTYLDIVRPSVKDTTRSKPIPTSAISSFEESIIGYPQLISDLRLYIGTDHDQLVLRSLALLQKLSSSRKLNSNSLAISSSRTQSRRVVDMLGAAANSNTASLSLASKMQIDIRELEVGPESPGYLIKDGILAFCNGCLIAQSDLPNIAHLLLGFSRVGELLIIGADGPLETGTSLLSGIIELVQNYPDGEDSGFVSWLVHIKAAAFQVLRHLWTSSLSSQLTLLELRNVQFFSSQFSKQALVRPDTVWDGLCLPDPSFWLTKSADALAEFLGYRAFLFEYTVTEIRSVTHSRQASLQAQILATLLGNSINFDGAQVFHVTIFDLFDFADIDASVGLRPPELRLLALVDVESCASRASNDSFIFYDLDAAQEVLNIAMEKLVQNDQIRSPSDEEQIFAEAHQLLTYLGATNRWSLVQAARRQALHMWVELVIATMECCPMEPGAKTQFALHVLQLILSKLDKFILDEDDDAIELARLADALVIALVGSASSRTDSGRTGTVITERLSQLFRTCIQGIHTPNTAPGLREICCSICSRYLARIGGAIDSERKTRARAMECVKSAGVPLVTMLCDDAEEGQGTCKLSALCLLGLLTTLAKSQKSSFIVETLVKANMLEVLIEPIKHISNDFAETEPKDVRHLFEALEAKLSLLLQISRTRDGAGYILDAGVLQAVRDSQMFRLDPDIGIDVDNSQALHNYYELIASVLRLLISTFLSRGIQNEQYQFQMRNFLQDYRPNVVGMMKKFAGVGGKKVEPESRLLLEQIVRSYVALMSMADFVQFEEEDSMGHFKSDGFL